MEARSVSSLWRNRDYLLLWSGEIVSELGTQVSQLAFPLLILTLTGSPAQAGLAGALRALPYLVFSLPAGALIDRWNRKLVMIVCDTGRALSLASIGVALALGHLTIVQIYLVSTIEGTLFVFFNLAEVACLPRVVPTQQLPEATAQNQITSSVSFLLGPPLGGILYGVSQLLPFLADALSYTVSVLSLLFIQTSFQESRVGKRRHLWTDIKDGLVWLWRQPLIRFMAFLTGCANLLITSSVTLIVIVVAQHMHASSLTIGLLLSIGGAGGIVGALVGPRIQKRWSFGRVIIAITCLRALLWLLLALVPNLAALAIVIAIFSPLGPIYDIVQFSYRMAFIPDVLQGRVNSVFRLIAFGGQPLGFALTGLLLQKLQAIPTILLIGGGLLLIAVVTALNPHVRNARPLTN